MLDFGGKERFDVLAVLIAGLAKLSTELSTALPRVIHRMFPGKHQQSPNLTQVIHRYYTTTTYYYYVLRTTYYVLCVSG